MYSKYVNLFTDQEIFGGILCIQLLFRNKIFIKTYFV